MPAPVKKPARPRKAKEPATAPPDAPAAATPAPDAKVVVTRKDGSFTMTF